MNPSLTSDRPAPSDQESEWLEVVRRKVGQLRFGSVQITVHEERVTLVESTEKTRFISQRDSAPGTAR